MPTADPFLKPVPERVPLEVVDPCPCFSAPDSWHAGDAQLPVGRPGTVGGWRSGGEFRAEFLNRRLGKTEPMGEVGVDAAVVGVELVQAGVQVVCLNA